MLLAYFADLRYDFQGTITSDAMPLGIGMMKAVMDKELQGKVISRLYATPSDLESGMLKELPDVLLMTNYIWNTRLSLLFVKYLKQHKPSALVIMGGPNISLDDTEKIDFLKKHPEIDIYVTGEGDFLATEIVSAYIDSGKDITELLRQDFHSSVYRKTGEGYVCTRLIPRRRALDDIPSPYLSGVMDKFFTGQFAPMIETNRGCPFTCTFCVQGVKWYTKVNYFSLERVIAELSYIGQKIANDCPDQVVLRIADPNYGMYERDLEISEHLGRLQKQYRWPMVIDATTGKNKADRIIKSIEKLSGALVMYQAVQSLDPGVLENIKRSNISLDAYADLQVYIQSRGLKSNSDLIWGLPGETLDSHLRSIQRLLASGINKISNFQAILLKGTELELKEQRGKYGLRSKFRLVPKNFGKYLGQKVFDVEEIIVSNDTISFDDYLEARKTHLAVSIFWNSGRFNMLIDKFQTHGLDRWEVIEYVAQKVKEMAEPVQQLFRDFLGETEAELFDSVEELYTYYSREEHFSKLIRNEAGDNLIYKYNAIANLLIWPELSSSVIKILLDLVRNKDDLIVITEEFRQDLTNYFAGLYLSVDNFMKGNYSNDLDESYNIEEWLENGEFANIEQYRNESRILIHFLLDEPIRKIIDSVIKVWNNDSRAFSMLIKRINMDWFKQRVSYDHIF